MNESSDRIALIFQAQLTLGLLLLGLGLERMLAEFNFAKMDLSKPLYLAKFLILLGSLILVLWVVQLIISWAQLYKKVDASQVQLGGFLDFWFYTLFTILVYLAISHSAHYRLMLIFLTLLWLVDIPVSYLSTKSANPYIRRVNKIWFLRNRTVLPLLLGFVWVVHLGIDGNTPNVPTIWSGAAFMICITLGYLYDIYTNWNFYQTHALIRSWRKWKIGKAG